MDYVFSAPAEEQALAAASSMPALQQALDAVLQLQLVVAAPEHRGRSMFCPELDRLIPAVAAKLRLPDVALRRGEGDACIVATEFYSIGGHSKVAEEIGAILGPDQTVAILTDAFRNSNHVQLLGGIIGLQAITQRARLLLGATTVVGKIAELYSLVAALRPGRIFLMAHHMDVIAHVALWPFRDVVEYVHHADHLPTLGATLAYGRHADLTWTCHRACRAAGLTVPPDYVGLGVPTFTNASARTPFSTPGRVRIATCGQRNKFHGGGAYRWADFAVAALSIPGAELLHIGPIDDGIRGEVTAALAAAGIDLARYVWMGAVPDLAAALIAQEVDVYLGSYPDPGGKATLEAMAAGLRPIVPIDASTPPLLRLSYPEAAATVIAGPEELSGAIAGIRAMAPADVARDLDNVSAESTRFRRYVAGA